MRVQESPKEVRRSYPENELVDDCYRRLGGGGVVVLAAVVIIMVFVLMIKTFGNNACSAVCEL